MPYANCINQHFVYRHRIKCPLKIYCKYSTKTLLCSFCGLPHFNPSIDYKSKSIFTLHNLWASSKAKATADSINKSMLKYKQIARRKKENNVKHNVGI